MQTNALNVKSVMALEKVEAQITVCKARSQGVTVRDVLSRTPGRLGFPQIFARFSVRRSVALSFSVLIGPMGVRPRLPRTCLQLTPQAPI